MTAHRDALAFAAIEASPASAAARAHERAARACRRWLAGQLEGAGPGAERDAMLYAGVEASAEAVLLGRALGWTDVPTLEQLATHLEAAQQPCGAWLDADGAQDLSATVLAWWALRACGRDERDDAMRAAVRVIHELGGAQRSNLIVRLWLSCSGAVPWTWVPNIPSELWLLPAAAPISPERVSAWARSVLAPFFVIASSRARLHLPDPRDALLCGADGAPIPPRLTRAGLAGDLLQAFDRAIRLSRKLPIDLIRGRARARALEVVLEGQQAHGGWFSVRPSLVSIAALRVAGRRCDDPVLRAAWARIAAGTGPVAGLPGQALGPILRPIAALAPLALAATRGDRESATWRWLAEATVQRAGPWQARAEAEPGGWPLELQGERHVDTLATARAIEALRVLGGRGDPELRALRRGTDLLFAMQEPDGSFARFERGEAAVPLSRLPWRDADHLNHASGADPRHEWARIELCAEIVAALAGLGWRSDNDRIARALSWLQARAAAQPAGWPAATVATVARAYALQLPPDAEPRRAIEQRLRRLQREDGSFGSLAATGRALRSLVALGPRCPQVARAERWIVERIERVDDAELGRLETEPCPGIGLGATFLDASAGVREAALALAATLAAPSPADPAAS